MAQCRWELYFPGAQWQQQVSGLVNSMGTGIIIIVIIVALVIKKNLVAVYYVLDTVQGTRK